MTAIQVGQAATTVLQDWPRSLSAVLRRMLPTDSQNLATMNISKIFGNFYRHLFEVLPRHEFGFLHAAFERFLTKEWKGVIRGQHHHFSAATRRNSHWMTENEAEPLARQYGRIQDLVRQGQIQGMFLRSRFGGPRTECWIRRKSLDQWIAARKAQLARYMSRPEAKRALGLANYTIVKVAAAGAIRYVEGPEHNFSTGFYFFLRQDVMKIKHAFEKHRVPMMAYSGPAELVTLRHAVKNYLGRGPGLAAVIQAVVGGALIPVGYTSRIRGITGYLFRSEHLRRYRPVPNLEMPSEGFLSYKEAASALGVKALVIRAMVAQHLLSSPLGYRCGLAKLVPTADIRRFGESYVPISVLAQQFHLHTVALTHYLKESGTPLLAVPLLDGGHAFFLRREIAAQTQLPSRRMLRKRAQLRLKDYRKNDWAKHRLAKEKALGRPLRRVRGDWGRAA